MILRSSFLVLFSILLCSVTSTGQKPGGGAIYTDSKLPIDKRVEDLVGRMTLEEKIGQLNMPVVYREDLGTDVQTKTEGCKRFAEGILLKGIGPGGGFFTLANTILPKGPRQQAEFFNELQRIATTQTRLKIPLLQTEEGTHGLMCPGGTVFPEGLAIGSTWNMDLAKEIYSAAAREARAVGIHQLFTLVIEPNRDPRMGRNEEGFSEDPYLCSRLAEAIVEGAQGGDVSAPDKVVSGLCHYPGQTQPMKIGHERGSMEITEACLREVFLPPWIAGIRKGALAIMATYPSINGIPTHASEWLLTKILREEIGFTGIVLSEGQGIGTIVTERIAATQKEAGELALKAGVDVSISFEEGYLGRMIENVNEGRVSMDTIDRAVRRILEVKFRLGLFENPIVDPEKAASVSHSKSHQRLALQAAREGIVLLKNENNLLPLKKDRIMSVAVIGPNADDANNQLGDYSPSTVLQKVTTVLDGLKTKLGSSVRVEYVKGCDVLRTGLNEIGRAQEAAKRADVALVVVGESTETDGEDRDVASLDLLGSQEDLVKAVYSTGIPTVVVLINGRPLSTRWIAENVPAMVEAWNCGEAGGEAIAEVLFGDYNPSGHLPITIPRHVGQLPAYYNYKPSVLTLPLVDMSSEPLFAFGHGLSYTTFDYSNLRISPSSPAGRIGTDSKVRISLDVRNSGNMKGEEVVQLYLNDVVASVTTPIKALKGFRKLSLNPGEKKNVEFVLTPYDLSLVNRDLHRVVEPGLFEVMIGRSSKDIRLQGSFQVLE